MECFEDEVRALERAGRPPVAFYGSSSIRLWSSLAEDFPGVGAVNLGFGGSTLEACVHFFERIVVPRHPRSLILYAGDNDLGDGRSPEQVRDYFRQFLAKFDASLPSIPLGFISIKPSPARWHLDANIRRLNGMAKEELAARSSARFIDIYPLMLGADGKPRSELYDGDGLHLSPAGYHIWREAISAHPQLLR